MKRRRLLIAMGTLAFVAAIATWYSIRLAGPSVVTNALVGWSESSIRADYGSPVSDEAGYQSLALYVPPSLPPGPLRSLRFHPRGLFHPRGGTLCVWLVERDGEWVCFESCWYRDGVVF
jgi:hypothetical protein